MLRDALASQVTAEHAQASGALLPAHGAPLVLPEHVCVVNEEGAVHTVDDAWPMYAAANYAGPEKVFIGSNYVLGCESNLGPSRKHASAFASDYARSINSRSDHFTIEYFCRTSTTQHWVEARIARLPGAPHHIAIIHRDVSARHRVDQELRRLRSLLSATDDAIILVDPLTQTIVDVNEATVRMLGRERSSYPSIPVEMLLSESEQEARTMAASLLAANPSANPFETTLRHADGRLIAAGVRPREVQFGEQSLVAFVTSDISERRRAEMLLRRQALQHHLLAQFGQLALENPHLNILTSKGNGYIAERFS